MSKPPEDKKLDLRPQSEEVQIRSREKAVPNKPKGGRCWYCGCKVHRTETICGECACERDGDEY